MSIPVSLDPLGTLGASLLPPGYTFAESVYFNGETWFDTGVAVGTSHLLRSSVHYGGTSAGTYYSFGCTENCLFHSRPYGFALKRAGVNMGAGYRIVGMPIARYTHEGIIAPDYSQVRITDTNGVVTEGGKQSISSQAEAVRTAYVGAGNHSELYALIGRFWWAEIELGGEVIARVVPCADNIGHLYLYDVVRKVFLTKLAGDLQP